MASSPIEIQESLERFRQDYPDQSKVGFLMMKFGSTDAHASIALGIKAALEKYDMISVRADDKQYHPDIYYNILTYLHGCSFGIAVFERIEQDDFNPNVSLEVGYLLAMGKPVCLLKDMTLNALQTDLVGKLYRHFDTRNPSETLDLVVKQWLADSELIERDYRRTISVVTEGWAGAGYGDTDNPTLTSSLHRLMFVVRPNRTVAVYIRRSMITGLPGTLRISFVFENRPGSGIRSRDSKELLMSVVESGVLWTNHGVDWLVKQPDPDDGNQWLTKDQWLIKGTQLVKEFPELISLQWLASDFIVEEGDMDFPDSDEPIHNFKIVLAINESDPEN